ncbi:MULTISPECIES: Mini-ribonuclease 3 [Clostridium]|uniref:Mini-ribonuclease 3 n=2 Tax=Clostridium TaxID=1485 RepID=A0A151AMD8_9CLOT|nr:MULTISPECIES: Mini-ribonuclease 3 [Clostridium]KYH28791.1 mini-ribonuclease 3 [Clostridium colicanis DSM 13634]MBE6043346.1 Mini-ribonuclease 3 [Clostridium thermopalmarium]PRR76154.1 Mini-ribonuclease 3 [Clostridium thermopalmarium DSM 5974]PVZ21393.1 ribonuclease-3 family protein [Clostridium thermopalmarium DSM 5974]
MKFDFLNNKLTINEAKQLNPLVLAFVGDSAYEVFIRTYLTINNREISAHKLHLKAISFVKAHSQSEFMKNIENQLNEDELAIYKRGRNAKSGTVPKNADIQEYRIATGFEAVIGFLYITNQLDRLNELLNIIINLSIN